MKFLSNFILTTVLGWKVLNDFPKLKKYLIIAAPHTSWQDFPLAILCKYAKGAKINYIGKASLFKPPFGFIFRWLGGAPVDRSKSNDKVKAIIDIFNSKENFVLGLSPEGTRQKVDKWKTGFYFIAKGADIPVVMASLDFKKKEIRISEPYYLSNSMEKDFKVFHSYFKGAIGKNPEFT